MEKGYKVIYLDIMIRGLFVCQLTYKYCPLFRIEIEELEKFVLEKRPTLRNKKFTIAFSNNRVI